jgi:predicted glutamine amidotransferase
MFESQETKALLHSKSLKGERAVLVCSEPLTEEKWRKIKFGNMVIIEHNLHMKEVQII